ncbi:MAG TPA: response regulator [Polyangiaceae bacterium]|nr:response regulator [Polyangiaceae bacterium]
MVDGGAQDGVNPDDRLAESRRLFVTSLGERMQVLSAALESLTEAPGEPIRRGSFQRRVHALGTACTALGFTEGRAAIARIENLLNQVTDPDTEGRLEQIARLLDMVPAMVLGGEAPLSRPPPAAVEAPAPISAVFYGLGSLAAGFEAKGGNWEVREVTGPEGLNQALRDAAPDVLIVDAAMPHAQQVVEQVLQDPNQESLRVVVVGAFERPEAAAVFLHAGVHRVLPKPLSPGSLERHVRELCQHTARNMQVTPLGEITLDELIARVHREMRRGLVECAKPGSREVLIPFGDGVEELAAVWGAVARIRELISMRSGGSVAFESGGPEGSIALAPWGTGERNATANTPRGEGSVSLAGRKVIVADDDPAVAWFIAGVLREAGAEVVEAADGQAALELAYELWPDLIVSDLLMPRLDGFELCRRIKRDLILSDVPVVVLSWKEDLLQRVRELGAGADGYLQKEANGSVITRSVREVLYARSRIEERFRKNPEVRGRLDNIAPRLVLYLAAKLLGNASVVIRDAAFLYEVELRSGRVAALQRTDFEGRTEHGVDVLGPLLGVRVGRFAVRRSSKAVAQGIDVRLAELVTIPVARARAAQSLLSAPVLGGVSKITVDESRVTQYLSLAPIKVRTVAAELLSGIVPTQIVETHGERVVEVLLQDLVLHDGVVEVYNQQGEAVLGGLIEHQLSAALVEERASQPPQSMPPKLPRSETPLGTPSQSSSSAPPARSLTPPLPRVSERAKLARVSLTKMSAADIRARSAPPRSLTPPPDVRAEQAAGDAEAHLAAVSPGAPASPAPALKVAVDAVPRAVSLSQKAVSLPPRPEARPAQQAPISPPSKPRDSEPELELGEAMIEQLLEPLSSAMAASQPAPPAAVAAVALEPKPVEPDPPIELIAKKSSAAPEAELSTVVVNNTPQPAAELTRSPTPRPSRPTPRPAYKAGLRLDESPMDAVMQSLTASESQTPAPAKPKAVDPIAAAVEESVVPAPAVLAPGRLGTFESARSIEEAERSSPSPLPPRSEIKWQHEQEIDPSSRAPDVVRAPAFPARINDESKQETAADRGAQQAVTGSSVVSKALPILLAVAAAAAAFGLMVALFGSEDDAPPPAPRTVQVAPNPTPAAPTTGATKPVKASVPAGQLVVIDRELPAEIAVTAGKGLLEVSAGSRHRIYVDGVFIGPGPVRRVPLSPGRHEVKLTLDGAELVTACEIRADRRTVVEHPDAAQQ